MSSFDLLVYLNGEYVRVSEAKVSVDDRGFLFADGVYEVTKLSGDFIFTEALHFARLRRGLSELRIPADAALEELPGVLRKLFALNNLSGQAYAYIQITRGAAAPRNHAWHGGPEIRPTVYAIVKPYSWAAEEAFLQGCTAIAVPDTRWARCDIKTVSLLPNILANQRAKEAGAYEALLTREVEWEGGGKGTALVEASHSNVFAVLRQQDGSLALVTPPEENILPGITRALIMSRGRADEALLDALVAAGVGRGTRESAAAAITTGHIPSAGVADGRVRELFVTASTSFVAGVTSVDGVRVGEGAVGPVTRAVREAWMRWWAADLAAGASPI
jgi:D-alanine transaminase